MLEPKYAEVGGRFLTYPKPVIYDDWGIDDNGNVWEYGFCVVDDFGDATPVSPFCHQFDDCANYLGPDYDPNTPPGESYKYVLYQAPICH